MNKKEAINKEIVELIINELYDDDIDIEYCEKNNLIKMFEKCCETGFTTYYRHRVLSIITKRIRNLINIEKKFFELENKR